MPFLSFRYWSSFSASVIPNNPRIQDSLSMRTVAALPQTVTLFTAPPAARSLTVTDVIVPMSVIFCDWKLPSACCVRILTELTDIFHTALR